MESSETDLLLFSDASCDMSPPIEHFPSLVIRRIATKEQGTSCNKCMALYVVDYAGTCERRFLAPALVDISYQSTTMEFQDERVRDRACSDFTGSNNGHIEWVVYS